MSKIVLTTIGSLGDLHPKIALGLDLRDRGHNVIFATDKELSLLDNPRYTASSAEIAQIVRAEDGVRVACDEIEKQLIR